MMMMMMITTNPPKTPITMPATAPGVSPVTKVNTYLHMYTVSMLYVGSVVRVYDNLEQLVVLWLPWE